ncbi:prorelaxin H1 [Puntigrus tetrazona]|uniref:prorelaxin H1 n=1 Tax=Puntigrus tetrazona TaxID=1606681 RepID=UPI001C89C3E8|nr:prorelaxin H1 [Puntigrus tetrazona]
MENHQKAAARGTPVFSPKLVLMSCVKMLGAFSALLLVCVCGVCVRGSADLPRDFGVKLCGREFIRAVIFTCGGSRWRRSASEPGQLLLDRDEELVPSLSDLLSVLSDTRTGDRKRDTGDRRRRNFSVGLAGMCCNQGCTKNDIGRLC